MLLPVLLVVGLVMVLIAGGLVAWLVWPESKEGGRQPAGEVRPSSSASASARASTSTSIPADYGGKWEGDLTTSAGNWTISITLQGDSTSGSVQYYRDGKGTCAGNLIFTTFVGGKLTMNESTPGCETTSGIVTMTLSGDRLFATWYTTKAKFDSGSPAYSGLLAKS